MFVHCHMKTAFARTIRRLTLEMILSMLAKPMVNLLRCFASWKKQLQLQLFGSFVCISCSATLAVVGCVVKLFFARWCLSEVATVRPT